MRLKGGSLGMCLMKDRFLSKLISIIDNPFFFLPKVGAVFLLFDSYL